MPAFDSNQPAFWLSDPESSGDHIPLPTAAEEQQMSNEATPEVLPILAVRNTVLFPGVVLPITVGRKKSIRLIRKAFEGDRIIGVVAQENAKTEDPGFEDLYPIGTVAQIMRMLVMPDGNTTVIIQGKRRFEIEKGLKTVPYLQAQVRVAAEKLPDPKSHETMVMLRSLKEAGRKILELNPELPPEAKGAMDSIDSLGFLTHFLSSNLNVDVSQKQELLANANILERATRLLGHLDREVQMLELKREIQDKVHTDLDQQQRDYYIRQQIRTLQEELGMDGADEDAELLRRRAAKKKWPQKVAETFDRELSRLERLNPQAAEYPLQVSYLEFLVDLPWAEVTDDHFDLDRAQKILDQDHLGLDKVKERILEYLAVLELRKRQQKENDGPIKAPILCLYGPPGVGKTSLGRSIARSLGRKYVRLSLGGLHDEAELRGHRKTYIGAMPGRILQNLRKVGSSNPVFVLDEIDKIGRDMRGDPSSALLEILDPEQNNTFQDNYAEVEYDLSQVLFIATANSLDTIQPALRDRLEIITLSGYTLEEKVNIARKHLWPKQKEENGLKGDRISISAKGLRKMIESYTRESGVRELERRLGRLCRALAKRVISKETIDKSLGEAEVRELMGPERYEADTYEKIDEAGIVTGLAWTPFGGDILTIEASLSRGRGKLIISGQLGDVMKESAAAALSYLRAQSDELKVDHRLFDQYDLHIHVPAGAVPKDGPSAGITMLTALMSLYTQRQVKPRIAMTGEITLRGKVLPVGGIKEKLLAAQRAGIREVILPKRNQSDVEEIEAPELKEMTFHFVSQAEEVLDIALLDKKVKKARVFELTAAPMNGSTHHE